MQFTRSFLVALLSAPFLASAQLAFTLNSTFAPVAGESIPITWSGTSSGGTVSLILRQGAASNLDKGTTIASDIPNNGKYTWTPDTNTVRGSDYALQIVSDSDPSDNNYSAQFVLESDNTVATPMSTVSNPASTAPPSSTLSGSASSTMTGSMTSSDMSSATSDSAQSSTSSQADLQATSSMPGAGARATAAVGVLGAVALAAMAL